MSRIDHRNTQASGTTRTPLQQRLYMTGIVALVVGLIAGAILYAIAPGVNSAESFYRIDDPRYRIELQQIGGNAAVLVAQFHQWFNGLWHGKPLAYTVAVLGAAIAGLCFFIGHNFAYADHDPDHPVDRNSDGPT